MSYKLENNQLMNTILNFHHKKYETGLNEECTNKFVHSLIYK